MSNYDTQLSVQTFGQTLFKPDSIDQFPVYKKDRYVKVSENEYYWMPKFKFKQNVVAADWKSD